MATSKEYPKTITESLQSIPSQKLAITPDEATKRQTKFKNIVKTLLWTDPKTAPVMAAKFAAQKIADKKVKQYNMTPQVSKILNDLQTRIGAKAGIPAVVFQSANPPTEIKDTVVNGHNITEATKFLANNKIAVKSTTKIKKALSDTGDAPSPNLDLGLTQYFDEARAEAMKLAVQSRTKALSTINAIEYEFKKQIEDASQLQKQESPTDLAQAKTVLANSDKESIAASVQTTTVDPEYSAGKLASGTGSEQQMGGYWTYIAIASSIALIGTFIWFKKAKKK